MKTELLVREFNGCPVSFTSDGFFCATKIAASYGKKPSQWLRLAATKQYIDALSRRTEVSKTHFVRSARGGSAERRRNQQATWLSPRLAVPFGRWLDANFAAWCDLEIDKLIRGQPEVVRQLQAQNAQLSERAKTLDRIAASTGVICMSDAAKALNVTFQALRNWMVSAGWIYQRGSQWVATSAVMRAGWLRNSCYVYSTDDDGRERIRVQVMVTGVGMVRLGAAFDEIVSPRPRQAAPTLATDRTAHELKNAAKAARKAIAACSALLDRLDAAEPTDVTPPRDFTEFEDS